MIKANPDSPQTHARRLALAQGKTLVMAVPRLRDQHPFRLLDPRTLSEDELREAATIKGALKHGKVIDLDQVPELDLVLTGSVAVNLRARASARAAASRTSSTACSSEAGPHRPPHRGGHHRPPDPDPAREPADDRPRHPGEHRGHAARGDRGGRRLPRARAGSSGTTSSRRRSTRSRCSSASATPASASSLRKHGLEPALELGPVLPPITPSSPTSSSFQGWTIVAATMPSLAGPGDVHRAVVHQHVDAELDAAGDLVERAVEVVVGHADGVEPARGGRRRRCRGGGS